MIDREVELGVVIGQRCADVPVERAREVVAGWTVVNDVSAGDLLDRNDLVAAPFAHDWLAAKAGDTFCPMGPGIALDRMLEDPQRLNLGPSADRALILRSFGGKQPADVPAVVAAVTSALTALANAA